MELKIYIICNLATRFDALTLKRNGIYHVPHGINESSLPTIIDTDTNSIRYEQAAVRSFVNTCNVKNTRKNARLHPRENKWREVFRMIN